MRYDKEGGTGWDTYSETTASQHWGGHQKIKEHEGDQRLPEEERLRKRETRWDGTGSVGQKT